MQNQSLEFIHDITQAMNESGEPDQVLDQILAACMQVTGAESGSIMLIELGTKKLNLHTAIGLVANQTDVSLNLGEGITGWVAKFGKSRLVNDTSKEKDYITFNPSLKSELAIPLSRQGKVFGVLSVDSSKIGAFQEEHERILVILANLAAQIFVSLKDNKMLKQRDRLHRVMIEVSKIITSAPNLKAAFIEIMAIAESSLGMHQSFLLLYEADTKQLALTASVGLQKNLPKHTQYSTTEGIVGKVFLNKKSIYIPEIKNEPEFLNRLGILDDIEDASMFACPIFSGNNVIGVFSAFTTGKLQLPKDHILEFLNIIASFISQAITIQKLVKEKTKNIESENIKLKQALGDKYRLGNLIGHSKQMLRLFETVQIVADSKATVLITGESGTGKELFASAIHYNSPRRDGPFIKINCAAIPESLLESELFGHKKGSFTGAVADKPGKFSLAHGGTIFLDEIGEMDQNLQSKLLRVLQEKEVEPIGGKVRKVDIRVIAATNASLEDDVAQKKFRSDLFYRLNVIRLVVPALRERKADILPLVHHFLKKYNLENNKNIESISKDAVAILESYQWPGNIRQLENIIERAVVMCQKNILDASNFFDIEEISGSSSELIQENMTLQNTIIPEVVSEEPQTDLIEQLFLQSQEDLDQDQAEGGIYKKVISEVERRIILMSLKKYKYTKIKAARFLGINRNTLDKKIRELNIEY